MNQKPSIDKAAFKKLLLDSFFEPFELEVQRQKKLLQDTEELYQSYYARLRRVDSKNELSKYINESNWLKNSLYKLLENEFPLKAEVNCEDAFVAFFSFLKTYTEALPVKYSEEQKAERFIAQPSDSAFLKLSKVGKKTAFHLSRTPKHILNLFAKEKKPIHYWRHEVPIAAMLNTYFRDQFLSKSLPFFRELQLLKCDSLNLKWQIDKEINIELSQLIHEDESVEDLLSHIQSIAEKKRIKEYADEFDRKLGIWKEECALFVDQLFESFSDDLLKVNTIELNSATFSQSNLAQGLQTTQREFLKIYNGWRNTLFAQIDDFQVDIELYKIKYSGLLQFSLLQNSCRSRIQKTVSRYIDIINVELDELLKPLEKATRSDKLIKSLQVERKKLHKRLESEIIPQAIDALYNQNIPNLLERLEIKIKDQVSSMKDRRIIYSKETYDSPISKSELSHFNPRELVEIDIFNRFSQQSTILKTEITHELEEIETSLNDLIGIVDYNLDSAINSVDENESEESIKSITREGLERTKAKTDNIVEELDEIQKIIDVKLKKAISEMNVGLIKLTKNENITQLRVKLAKAKAVETTEAYRKELIDNVRNFIPIFIRYVRQKYSAAEKYFQIAAKKIGLFEEKIELTAELTDFLTQTEIAIAKLPYVYRRLYQIKPLEEEVFFEGRIEEMNKLTAAYENWENGNYSATIIIGEKGSGASSLVNFFKKDHPPKEIIRHKFLVNHSSEEDFLSFFRTLLEKPDLENLQDVSDALNSREKTIIILEDVQHFFLKKIHGFDAINLLFELISETADRVFWMIEITSYAEQYLQKTIEIERYFKYIVYLGKLKDEQIVRLIMKRHRVSGYNLKFEIDQPTAIQRRKLAKMDEEAQQNYLKIEFFKELNSFAQSNISLALLYWLRSTSRVENNTIYIGRISNVKFNFLSSLQQISIFTLHVLLIHDSLSITEHALIFNQSEKQSRMNFMVLEDGGILNSEGDRFFINRLLYRQVVTVLTSKNILH